jgi:hypothetical protein
MKWLRRLMAHLYDGSIVIGRRTRAWPWEKPEWRSTYGRLAWMLACGWAWWRMVSAFPTLMAISVAVFLVAAFRASVKAVREGTATAEVEPEQFEAEGQDDEDEEQLHEELTPQQFLTLLQHIDGPAVHLAQLAAHLTGNPRDTAPVRRLCKAAGVPITAVRVPGRGVSTGVRLAGLPTTPPPGATAGTVLLPQVSEQQQHGVPRIVRDRERGPNAWKVEWK